MEEIMKKIVEYAVEASAGMGPDDRYMLLNDVARQLEAKADRLIAMEYMEGVDDE